MPDCSPSTQLDRLVKPPFVHGRLHQLCLQQMIQSKNYPDLPPFSSYMPGKKSVTNHLHALHQRQTHGLVTGQADDAGRSVGRGLHQGDHCLDPQPAALQTRTQPKVMCRVPSAAHNVYRLSVGQKLRLLSTCEGGERQVNVCVITEVEPWSQHPSVIEEAGSAAVGGLTRILSNADGVPPRWTWPSTVSLVS